MVNTYLCRKTGLLALYSRDILSSRVDANKSSSIIFINPLLKLRIPHSTQNWLSPSEDLCLPVRMTDLGFLFCLFDFICPIQPSYTFPMPSPQELLVVSLLSAQRDFTYLLSPPLSRQGGLPDSITDTISSNSAHIHELVLDSPVLLCPTEFKTG